MKIKYVYLLLSAFFTISCRSYLDVVPNVINTNYMTFRFDTTYNELNYFNGVNSTADNQILYTTHFTIKLPKDILYWHQAGNKFYYEYDSKQVILINSAYKNTGQESDNWELKNVATEDLMEYMDEYWESTRGYSKNYLEKMHDKRITKLYTNGKYSILLFNIRKKNFSSYLNLIKSFKANF
jgi:hypothetical protein